MPGLAAVIGGGLWILATAPIAALPAPPDWPGYLLESLPVALLAVICLTVAVAGAWLREDGRGGVLGRRDRADGARPGGRRPGSPGRSRSRPRSPGSATARRSRWPRRWPASGRSSSGSPSPGPATGRSPGCSCWRPCCSSSRRARPPGSRPGSGSGSPGSGSASSSCSGSRARSGRWAGRPDHGARSWPDRARSPGPSGDVHSRHDRDRVVDRDGRRGRGLPGGEGRPRRGPRPGRPLLGRPDPALGRELPDRRRAVHLGTPRDPGPRDPQAVGGPGQPGARPAGPPTRPR